LAASDTAVVIDTDHHGTFLMVFVIQKQQSRDTQADCS